MKKRLAINHTEAEGIVTVGLSGRLDIETVPDTREYLEKLVKQPGIKLILDLAELTYISSFGLSLIVGLMKEVRRGGGELVLARMTPFVTQVIDVANLGPLLRSFDSLADASAALK